MIVVGGCNVRDSWGKFAQIDLIRLLIGFRLFLLNFQTPIGTLDLGSTVGLVEVAPRDICARLNTLMVELRNDGTKSRYLLSSDTKEEREAWKAQFNKSITLMNSWSGGGSSSH